VAHPAEALIVVELSFSELRGDHDESVFLGMRRELRDYLEGVARDAVDGDEQ
jgi:hypothetical protein